MTPNLPSIYEQHTKAFKDVSAYVVTDKTGKRLATVAFKRGDAVTCYLHILGLEMTRGRAGGGGYDRASAAAYDAVSKARAKDNCGPGTAETLQAIYDALKGDGQHWDNALVHAGFNVLQAV